MSVRKRKETFLIFSEGAKPGSNLRGDCIVSAESQHMFAIPNCNYILEGGNRKITFSKMPESRVQSSSPLSTERLWIKSMEIYSASSRGGSVGNILSLMRGYNEFRDKFWDAKREESVNKLNNENSN